MPCLVTPARPQLVRRTRTRQRSGDTMDDNRKKALAAALTQIEKQFGKGSVMRMGDAGAVRNVEVISTGSLGLDLALGCRRRAQGPGGRDLRPGVLRQDHADPAHRRRGPEAGRHRRLRRRGARPRSGLRREARRQYGRAAGLPAGYRRAGAGDHRHAGAFRRGGRGGGGFGGGPDPEGRDRGRDGRFPRRACRRASCPRPCAS